MGQRLDAEDWQEETQKGESYKRSFLPWILSCKQRMNCGLINRCFCLTQHHRNRRGPKKGWAKLSAPRDPFDSSTPCQVLLYINKMVLWCLACWRLRKLIENFTQHYFCFHLCKVNSQRRRLLSLEPVLVWCILSGADYNCKNLKMLVSTQYTVGPLSLLQWEWRVAMEHCTRSSISFSTHQKLNN